jgi:hypothetical protein
MLVGKGTGRSGFSFAPLNIFLRETRSDSTLLDKKVVCSKPCHGMNLVSAATRDYLCNPCTGFHRCYSSQESSLDLTSEEHAFTVGSKNVGLTFDALTREHVVVEIFYNWKDFKSRQYDLTCTLRWCRSWNPARLNSAPPLPVNDMPPAYLDGMLYWMSEPRLGHCYKRAIVQFDIATRNFGVILCPSIISTWNKASPCQAFVVELEGTLCAVLADPVAKELDIWKLLKNGQWDRAYKLHLKGWSGYSLMENVVVPLAVDPKDGRILLSTGRKLGLYDLVNRSVENLYSVDEVSTGYGVVQWNNLVNSQILSLVPMLYEESLASYPRLCKGRWFY